MHRLNTILVGLMFLLTATALAHALDTGTTIAQAQTGGQAGGPDPMDGQSPMRGQGPTGSSVMDRMNEGTSSPMASPMEKDKAKSAYRGQGRSAKKDPARGDAYQPRDGKKQESNSGE